MSVFPFDAVIHLVQNRTLGQSGGVLVICAFMLAIGYFTYKPRADRGTFGWRWLGVMFIVALCLQAGEGKIVPLTFACIGLLVHFSYDVIYKG